MKYKDVLALMSKEQKTMVAKQFDAASSPRLNGGLYLSPAQFDMEFNKILSLVLNRVMTLNSNTINAILTRIEKYN